MNKIILAVLLLVTFAGTSHANTTAKQSANVPSSTYTPKIHLVDVEDKSGCKGLKGGLASSAGTFLGGLAAYKLKRGAGAIRAAGAAGEKVGNEIDSNARCTQAINVQPGIVR